jgi:Protein of unknown function (DUF4232)
VGRGTVALVVVLLCAAVGAGAAPADMKAASCRTSELVVWVDTTDNATAGSSYVTLKFTNQSGHTCAIGGYPGVSAVDLRGRQLGSPASRNLPSTRVRPLANGDTASAILRIAVAGNYPAAVCRRRAAAGLRVYPPNQTSAKIVPLPFEACSRTGPRFLSVNGIV